MDLDSRGQYIKLIPSLNGRLYKFNGEVVEPIPMNVDSLLGTVPYQDIMNEITMEENKGYFAKTNQLGKPPPPLYGGGSFSFSFHLFQSLSISFHSRPMFR
jgi:hypothetical protein